MARKVEPQEAKESINRIFEDLESPDDHDAGRVSLLSRAMRWEAAPPCGTDETFLAELAELVAECEAAKLRDEEVPPGLKALLLRAKVTVRMTLLRQEGYWLANSREIVEFATSKEFAEAVAKANVGMVAELSDAFAPPAESNEPKDAQVSDHQMRLKAFGHFKQSAPTA